MTLRPGWSLPAGFVAGISRRENHGQGKVFLYVNKSMCRSSWYKQRHSRRHGHALAVKFELSTPGSHHIHLCLPVRHLVIDCPSGEQVLPHRECINPHMFDELHRPALTVRCRREYNNPLAHQADPVVATACRIKSTATTLDAHVGSRPVFSTTHRGSEPAGATTRSAPQPPMPTVTIPCLTGPASSSAPIIRSNSPIYVLHCFKSTASTPDDNKKHAIRCSDAGPGLSR